MGFFDFVKRAVSTVAGINVDNGGILGALGSVVGMVSHAIPVVGPIIDVGINAMSAIFSDDSPNPNTPAKPELDRAVSINLQPDEAKITKALNESIQHLADDMNKKYTDLANLIGESEQKLKEMFSHSAYLAIKADVIYSIQFMIDKKTLYKDISASSAQSVFDGVFDNSEGSGSLPSTRYNLHKAISVLKTHLEDTGQTPCPSQEMFDLYLLAVQHLFLFDKVSFVIVTRGLNAKLHRTNKSYGRYIDTVTKLYSDIHQLHVDAKETHRFLKTLVENIVKRRPEAISQDQFVETGQLAIKDTWPALAIGWTSKADMANALPFSLDRAVDIKADVPEPGRQALIDSTKREWACSLTLYRDITSKILDAKLHVAYGVIDTIEENLRQWNSRLPLRPVKLPTGSHHVRPVKTHDDKDQKTPLPLWGTEVRYLVTYVSIYGESPASHLSDVFEIEKSKKPISVELELPAVQVEDDLKAGLPPVMDEHGNPVSPEHGVRRRIYVQYKESNELIYDLVGEVAVETETKFLHILTPPKH